jgi:hypothetical protein
MPELLPLRAAICGPPPGAVTLPEPLDDRVERVEFFPAPCPAFKTNVAVVSWKDKLYITFGSRARAREVERRFFTLLSSLSLCARIECTGRGEKSTPVDPVSPNPDCKKN